MPREVINIKVKHIMSCLIIFGFLLGVQNGYVALWEDGKAEPIRVFPYPASNLPQKDQQALEAGIHLDNKLQLIKLIEDYLS